VVDNTVGVGLLRPIDYGADIVVISATKFIGGHGNSIGGVIVDSGKFNWGNGKFPEISEPDPSYHGLNFWETFRDVSDLGNVAFIFKVRTRWLRDVGAALSPFNSFLFITGLETLALRQQRHSENALAVAHFLKNHPRVAGSIIPALKIIQTSFSDKIFEGQYGALVGFGIKGGLEAGKNYTLSKAPVSPG